MKQLSQKYKPPCKLKPSKIHQELIQRVVMLHQDLMRAGLLATGHKMHEVVREIGYEVACKLEQKEKRATSKTI